MRRKHDRVSRLDRDDDLEDSCRGRIGRRNDRRYDTPRRSDLDDAAVVRGDTDGF